MKFKRFLVFIAILSLHYITAAQTPKQNFERAEEFYKNTNYSEAISYSESVKKSLGKSNPKIEAMLFMAYYNNQEYAKAKIAFETLKRMVPASVKNSETFALYKITGEELDTKLAEIQADFEKEQNKRPPSLFTEEQYANKNTYKEGRIKKANEKIQDKIKEEELYKSAKMNKSVSTYGEFLSSFPKSDYFNEIQELLLFQKEEDLWVQSKSQHTVTSYYEYLSSYPSGKYQSLAKTGIESLDKLGYEKAISIGTQESLNYYLVNYKKGEYRGLVREKLNERIEYDIYMHAKTNSSIENYETYIKQYANGKYASEVNNVIKNSYFRFANEAYASKDYTNAISNYSKYINNYPGGEDIDKARKGLKKASAKSKQTSSGYFGFTYESQGTYGLTLGRLKKDGIGLYTNLRVSPDVLALNFNEAEVELSEDEIPEDEKIAIASLSVGISYPVYYPVWLYVGAGANYQQRLTDEFDDNTFYKLEGEEQLAFYPEGGIKVRFGKRFAIIAGVVFLRGEMLYKVGIGF